jgi:hypothetical protein
LIKDELGLKDSEGTKNIREEKEEDIAKDKKNVVEENQIKDFILKKDIVKNVENELNANETRLHRNSADPCIIC